ncbi:MAG: hypothetical protein ABIT71_21655 [Vicinamibacteraceae bacterium]
MRQPFLPDPPGTDEAFYIGYDPPMPPPLARRLRRAVIGVVALGAVGAALVALRHRDIAGGTFAFGHVEPVSGVVVEHPYPALRIAGRTASTLLVATGKHGAGPLVHGLTDRAVIVQGQRISRDGNEMLEIAEVSENRSPEPAPGPASEGAPRRASGGAPATLRGEIVDSKCFLGVMTPGQGKTHRACASLCLRGGIPPALFVDDGAGRSRLILLVSPAGDALDPSVVADRAFEPTEMAGLLAQADGWWVLRTDPATWRRIAH